MYFIVSKMGYYNVESTCGYKFTADSAKVFDTFESALAEMESWEIEDAGIMEVLTRQILIKGRKESE